MPPKPELETAQERQLLSRGSQDRTLPRNALTMDHIVHQAGPGAIGQSSPDMSGNTYASRPNRYAPQFCDCCNRPVGYFDVQRTTSRFECGELPSYVCYACLAPYPDGEPSALRIRWIIARAGRFGIQWQEAVKAQLGWPA